MRAVILSLAVVVVPLFGNTFCLSQDALDELERLIDESPADVPGGVAPPIPDEPPARARADVGVPAFMGVSVDNHRFDGEGTVILSVRADGPAAAAGLQAGDVIVALNREDTLSVPAFAAALAKYSAGDKVAVEALRGGRRFEFTVTMGPRDDFSEVPQPFEDRGTTTFRNDPTRLDDFGRGILDRDDPAPLLTLGRPILGIQIGPLYTRNYRLLGIGINTSRGVIVEDVVSGSPAEKHGVPRGAILIGINGLRVETVDDVMAMMARLPEDRPVELTYVIGGRSYRNVIPLAPVVTGQGSSAPLDLPPPPPGPDVEFALPLEEPKNSRPTPAPAAEDPSEVKPPAPEAEVRLPPATTAAKTPTEEPTADAARVKALQEELRQLRERAAALEAALGEIRTDESE